MLYTRKGDKGTSGLFGTKERLPKNSPVYDALGIVDELNSLLGICRARSSLIKSDTDVSQKIKGVQECLFIIQAEIAGAEKSITKTQVNELEEVIGQVENLISNPHAFVIPGATEFSALCDYARAVARRAERATWRIKLSRNVSPESLVYLNRLSSFLYVLARYGAIFENVKESSPTY
jgi:cob(I)alamin adenosyltransferase